MEALVVSQMILSFITTMRPLQPTGLTMRIAGKNSLKDRRRVVTEELRLEAAHTSTLERRILTRLRQPMTTQVPLYLEPLPQLLAHIAVAI